ncbi:MAG: twin-arginine translocase TatA/TatE family subunit [Desulfobulbaceae bacterium]|nr:twin-arginine translocase TatA/TatE family subunit [Desulfobulbaceae bacterium]
MFGIGLPELILILAVALIVVGPEKLPDLAKNIAKQVFELKKAASTFKESLDEVEDDKPWEKEKNITYDRPGSEESAASAYAESEPPDSPESSETVSSSENSDGQGDEIGNGNQPADKDEQAGRVDETLVADDSAGVHKEKDVTGS